ncbi:hypothetical protein PZ938_16590 [Luteipulveratus sp. YIM 133132]|uniref:hypothetical protein n=1 Tax=Luteipulveratus flavus TaxID=3031728 RepID=UPI0023AFA972|nr:hypothetical protein [Luteipulveratus sp. YIM 133132]MDE9367239.1 hypothetical protein [Luteipulveratus sp. YIM 133132]
MAELVDPMSLTEGDVFVWTDGRVWTVVTSWHGPTSVERLEAAPGILEPNAFTRGIGYEEEVILREQSERPLKIGRVDGDEAIRVPYPLAMDADAELRDLELVSIDKIVAGDEVVLQDGRQYTFDGSVLISSVGSRMALHMAESPYAKAPFVGRYVRPGEHRSGPQNQMESPDRRPVE